MKTVLARYWHPSSQILLLFALWSGVIWAWGDLQHHILVVIAWFVIMELLWVVHLHQLARRPAHRDGQACECPRCLAFSRWHDGVWPLAMASILLLRETPIAAWTYEPVLVLVLVGCLVSIMRHATPRPSGDLNRCICGYPIDPTHTSTCPECGRSLAEQAVDILIENIRTQSPRDESSREPSNVSGGRWSAP